MACGASVDEIACRTAAVAPALLSATSGRLRHLAATEAPRADADALGRPVNQRADGLKVRLEAARADIVRVRHRPADDRTLIADFAALGHASSGLSRLVACRRQVQPPWPCATSRDL